MVTVRRCKIADIEDAPDVVSAYEAEAGDAELGRYRPDWTQYKVLEEAGWVTCLGAFQDQKLVGMLVVLAGPNAKIGVVTASAESFFVMPDFRSSGAWMTLLKEAVVIAKEKGAAAFFVSTKTGSRLSKVMNGMKSYNPHSEVFCKVLVPRSDISVFVGGVRWVDAEYDERKGVA